MKPMFLDKVENFSPPGERGEAFKGMRAAGVPIPQIMHLIAFKPEKTDHLSKFTQEVMRGESELPSWQREMIAALTSKLNQCLF